MANLEMLFRDAKRWLELGEWEAAEKVYLDIIGLDSSQADAWHYLGVLYAEQGWAEKACDCLQKAITLRPDDPTFYLHYSTLLKSMHNYEAAREQLQAALAIDPLFPAIYNNLGSISFAEERWQEAVSYYQEAIGLQPNYLDAYYNLGLAFNKLQYYDDAFKAYEALLSLAPTHPGCLFQLGCLHMRLDQNQKALQYFHTLESLYPYHFETQTNLASCYLRQGDLAHAKVHYLKAADINENDAQVLFNLGVLNAQSGRLRDAITYYQRALSINPSSFETHNNVAVTFLALKDKQQALIHFKEALRIKPGHIELAHTIAALKGDQSLDRAPSVFIESLFDSYADRYDAHMGHQLVYTLPDVMMGLLSRHHVTVSGSDILDLGCGTGLMGQRLRVNAGCLVGVDLSKRMLEQAKAKACYQELIHSDVIDYLSTQHARFNLIVAADVLVYFGELSLVFKLIYQALVPGGVFLFSCEVDDENTSFHLQSSGRFAHHVSYIEDVISKMAFTVIDCEACSGRVQDGRQVAMAAYLLQR